MTYRKEYKKHFTRIKARRIGRMARDSGAGKFNCRPRCLIFVYRSGEFNCLPISLNS